MTYYVFSIGSNYGAKHENVEDACRWLSGFLGEFKKSTVYETNPLKGKGANYANAVVSGYYLGDFNELYNRCKEYEKSMGRTADMKKEGFIPIDIDIVIADENILRRRDFDSLYFKKGFDEINYNRMT